MQVPGELGPDPLGGRARLDVATAILAAGAVAIAIALIGLPGGGSSDNMPGPAERVERPAPGAGAKEPAPMPEPEPRAAPPADAGTAVEEVLTPPADGPKPEIDKMAASIAAFGDGALPVVLAILCGEAEVPEFALGKPDQAVHQFAIEHQQEILIESLKRFRRPEVLVQLRLKGTGGASLDNRLVVAHLLGELKNAAALEIVLAVATGIEPIQLERTYVQNTLEQAIADCISADATCVGYLQHVQRNLPAALLPVVARGVGRTHGEAGARMLAQLLGQGPALDEVVLGELARMTETNGIVLPETSMVEVRRLLDHPSPAIQRTAVAVLGRLRDRGSFDAIAGKLTASDRAVAASAAWSLAYMSHAKLGADPERWLEWNEQQEAWWSGEAPALLAKLRGSDMGDVLDAVTQLTERPLFVHDVAEAIAALATTQDPALAVLAIGQLQQLGSSRAVPALVQALAIDDSRRAPAVHALRALTGIDLPGDFGVWSKVFPAADWRQ